MNKLVKSGDFTHELFGRLTTIKNENNEVFFLAKEISIFLEYSDSAQLTRRLDEDETIKLDYENSKLLLPTVEIHSSGIQLLTESGLYNSINRARKISSKQKHDFISAIKEFGYFKAITLTSTQEADFFYCLQESLKPFDLEIQKQYFCLGYKVDGYIESLKIAIEYDENGHNHYCSEKEKTRQIELEKELGCEFIRVSNLDSNNFNIGLVIKNIFKIK